jgi:hypothetical protein
MDDFKPPRVDTHREPVRHYRIRGFLLFCCGPLLYLLAARLTALGHPLPDLLVVPIELVAMAAGGFIMVMGTEKCVVCNDQRVLFPSGRVSQEWVCHNCLLPYELPIHIGICPYCKGTWRIRSRYERHLAFRYITSDGCSFCSAPMEPTELKKILELN